MKKLLLSMLGVLIALPAMARDFTYTYEGQTVTYTVIDEDAKTCMTAAVFDIHCDLSGKLILPEHPEDNGTEYTLTTIGVQSFSSSKLTSIVIPESVKEIGNDAFIYCSSLTSVKIMNPQLTIKRYIFDSDVISSIDVASINQAITFYYSIGAKNAAYYLNGKSIYVPDYVKAANSGNIYSKDGKTFIYYSGENEDLKIPEGVTTILPYSFADKWPSSLTIPSTIEEVGEYAFVNCSIVRVNFADFSKWYNDVKLGNIYSNPYLYGGAYEDGVKVTVPELKEGMVEIPDYKNAGLTLYTDEVELPSTLKRIGAYAFYNNRELYHVFMPEGLEEIGESAFEGCVLLENPQFPSTLTTIENLAFSGCKSLSSIDLPERVNSLGLGVFAECTKLEKAAIVCNVETIPIGMFRGCSALYKVYFPTNLKEIGGAAFARCYELDKITFPSTLEKIGQFAFHAPYDGYYEGKSSHGKLTSLTIPNSVKEIGTEAFEGQPITKLILGSGLERIESGTFNGNNLKTISFSEGLKEIGFRAFAAENNIFGGGEQVNTLSSVIFPSTLTTIGKDAFKGRSIAEMVIPDGITDLPSGSCGNPASLTIGSGIKTISNEAFGFENLHTLRIKSLNPPTFSDVITLPENQDLLTLIVNKDRKPYYVTKANWRLFETVVEEGDTEVTVYMTGDPISQEIRLQSGLLPASVTGLKVVGSLTDNDMRLMQANMISLRNLDLTEVDNMTAIPDGQFEGSVITNIKLPAGLKSIGNNAFSNCPLLVIDALPEGIEEIGDNAFANSPLVDFAELPESLTRVGSSAFNGTAIRELTAGTKLSEIGSYAFASSMLESIDLSKSQIRRIENGTFSNCVELDEILLPETCMSIGYEAFSGTAISDIDFTAGTAEIGENAFSNCRRLVSANLPEELAAVRSNLLSDCPRLISASMAGKTTSVGELLFNNDAKIATISCAALEAPEASRGAFSGIRKNYAVLTIPTISFKSYLNAVEWGSFKNISNTIAVKVEKDNGVDVSNVTEPEYQEMLREDELEAAAEQAAQDAPAQVIARRHARRAAGRASNAEGRRFATLFDGAQFGNPESATRIFINPKDGVKVTSILFNGEEMLNKLEGNSLLLPARASGSLVIKTDSTGDSIINAIGTDNGSKVEVYSLSGLKIADSLDGLPRGIYIVRKGGKTTKVVL